MEDNKKGWKLSAEELARLDGEEEEAIRTGTTPLMDLLLPGHDRAEEELMDLYRKDVERRLGANAPTTDDWDAFFDHIEFCFKHGIREADCAARWSTRIN